MYTVLIVDDEALVRKALAQIIDWDSLGFTRVLQAEDGVEALEIVKKEKIDLVLTDIVMPFMDGMELTKELAQHYPGIHVVILTGHEDFEYAQKSVDLGVKNYILKPVGAATLYSKMKEICRKLNIEEKQKKYIAQMRSQLNQSIPIMRERILNTIVCTRYGGYQEGIERAKCLGIILDEETYGAAVVDVELSEIVKEDMELYNFAAKNIAAECVGKKRYVFEDNNNKLVILFQCEKEDENAKETFYNTLQVIQKAIYSILKTDVTCAMGNTVNSVEKLYQSYHEAQTALECKYSLGINSVYTIQDLNYIEQSFYYPTQEIKEFVTRIKYISEREVYGQFEKIQEGIRRNRILSKSNMKMILLEIVTLLLKELSEMKDVKEELWNEGFCFFKNIERMDSLNEVFTSLTGFAVRVAQELQGLQKDSGRTTINQVKVYVEQNYMNSEISLSTAAEQVGVSTGYLSSLFKKETGKNFVKYLQDVRMEKSKELLKTTDKKTYEIAYETGFANPHYFSVTFKKYTGMSPSDFRLV